MCFLFDFFIKKSKIQGGSKMTHSELKEWFAEEYNVSKVQADTMIKGLFSKVAQEVEAGNTVKLINLGTAKRVLRNARTARNPQDPEAIINIPAHYVAKITVEKSVKEALKAVPVAE